MPRNFHHSGSADVETERQSGIILAIALGLVLVVGIALVVSGLS